MGPKDKEEEAFDKGREAGQKWAEWAKEHPYVNGLNPLAPRIPHKSGDAAFNEGVEQGIDDKKK